MNLASTVAATLSSILTAPSSGDLQINVVLSSLASIAPVALDSVTTGNASADLNEKSLTISYPTLTIFCQKLSNTLKEKFRTFSGTAETVIEVRQSQDQLQNIQGNLETYVSAVCQILDGSRGDWGNGMFYPGGYVVSFGAVKRGGKNFIQTGQITLNVDLIV
jgi:hypothetical protein